MKRINPFFWGLLFSCSLLFLSCSSPVQEMEAHFNSGQYLQAAESAVEAMRDPALKEQVRAFMQDYGDLVVEKALLKGELLLERDPTERTIIYLKAVIRVFEEMALLDFPVPTIEKGLVQGRSLLRDAVEKLVARNYQLGKETFARKMYRKSGEHFTLVQSYLPHYKNVDLLLDDAVKKANRRLTIKPFLRRSNVVSQIINHTISNMFGADNVSQTEKLNMPLRIGSIDIPFRFSRELLAEIKRLKSDYIQVSLEKDTDIIPHSHYYLKGSIDAEIEDFAEGVFDSRVKDVLRYSYWRDGELEWTTTYFNYDVYKSSYAVSVFIDAGLYLKKNDEKVADIAFEKSASQEVVFRTEGYELPHHAREMHYPISYLQMLNSPGGLNREEVVRTVLTDAAVHLAAEVLEVVDKDLDPYQHEL